MASEVPQHIVDTINTLLAPYGEAYSPGEVVQSPRRKGYMTYAQAVAYTGLSKQTLRRAVSMGQLARPHKLNDAVNGMTLFAIEDIDQYILSR